MKFSADLKVGQARLVRKVDLENMAEMISSLKIGFESVLSRNKDEMLKSDVVEMESLLNGDVARILEYLHIVGFEYGYYGDVDIGFRNYVLKRDSYKCQFCGSGDCIDAHHIVPARLLDVKDGYNHPANGVTLCGKCHDAFDKDSIRKFIFFNRCWCSALKQEGFGGVFFGARDYSGTGKISWDKIDYREG